MPNPERRLRALLHGVKFVDSVPKSAKRSRVYDDFNSYYVYYENEGMVDWFIENMTNEDKYVVLYRGGLFKDANIPFYILGSEFAEIYFARGESTFIQDLGKLTLQNLAILDDGSRLQIGAVFFLPARGIIQIPELGYKNLKDVDGEVIEVKCVDADLYAVFYDYGEVSEYRARYGHDVFPPHDPYAISSLKFSISNIGYMPTFRYIVPFNVLNDNKDDIDVRKNSLLSLFKLSR